MDEQFSEIHERVIAGRLLSIAAAHISKHMDSFCSWLLIGVGAAYTLILANLASLKELISPRSLQVSLLLLLVAIILGVLQRWLAAMVAANVATGEKADQIGRDLAEQKIEMDFKVVLREMERGAYYPAKWMVRRAFNKAMSGDLAVSGRLTSAISQIQGWLVLLLVGFVVAAIAVTACGVGI